MLSQVVKLVAVIARDYVEKDYAVVLSRLVRVTFIFSARPRYWRWLKARKPLHQATWYKNSCHGFGICHRANY